jgi:large subunit ribosomal protein L10
LSLNRNEKAAVIEEVAAQAAKSQTLALAEYRGLTVEALNKLRVDARAKGVYLHVLKNTLARRAVAGTPFEVASESMAGPATTNWSSRRVPTLARPWTPTASRRWRRSPARKSCWPRSPAC